MFWKLYSSIIFAIFLINLAAGDTDIDQPNNHNVLPLDESPQASMPEDNQEFQGADFIQPSRPGLSSNARNPHVAATRPTPTRVNQPSVPTPIRSTGVFRGKPFRNTNVHPPKINTPLTNNRGSPFQNNAGVVQAEPSQNMDTNQPDTNAPINNDNSGFVPQEPPRRMNVKPPKKFTPVQNNADFQEQPPQDMNSNQPNNNGPFRNNDAFVEENPLQNVAPNQAGTNEPSNDNGEVVPEETFQNPNPNLNQPNQNVPMRNDGVAQVDPSQNQVPLLPKSNRLPTAPFGRKIPPSNRPIDTPSNAQGPAAFGGKSWPDFFRKPHETPNNVAPSNTPMQTPPVSGEQMNPGQDSQASASVDQLLNKLNSLFGNNQGGNGGMGR